MTEKEEKILKEIINYYKENKIMPSIRFIAKKLHYKSHNSVYQTFKSLEKKKYLIRHNNKLILNETVKEDTFIKIIPIVNTNKTVNLFSNKKGKYLAFKLTNNYFINDCLKKGDILIVKEGKSIKENELGLFIIDGKYRIMKYNYKDGFYLLSDKEQIILYKIKLIGKVIKVLRTM